uniref:Putative methyltransferase NSUN7 n=1 Tax=Mastacembelus armatus TaxID=205130 RepID=A0A7N8Y7Q2_9TELE
MEYKVSPPSDQVYLQASAIFQQLREEKPVPNQLLCYGEKTDAPLPMIGDKHTQRQAYELAFSTLKYQDLLENIIIDSCFHTSQHISSDLFPLAMVMLFDFQARKFLLRKHSTKEGKEHLQEVTALESSLHRSGHKTKLAAALACCRVKQNLQSVSCFLSDPVRTKQHRAKHLPLYAWVNTLKTSVEEVCKALQCVGLCEVKNMTEVKELMFCKDSLCPDTLVFSQHLHALLQHNSLTTTHVLNIQDRSVCVAGNVLRPLLFENSDTLVVGSFSAETAAHVAVVAAARSGRVLVCGADHTPLQIEELKELLREMDIKSENTKTQHCLKKRLLIILLPQCSSSALSDPVPTMHSEHGDWDLLTDLSHGSVSQRKIHTMVTKQARLLAHALSFPKVQTVVYCTRSIYPEENEQLVKRVLEKTQPHPKLLPFRVNGPIFPDDSKSGDTTDSRFFRLEPSQFTNGCFVARLSRQVRESVETVHDVLARAAAKGLLGGITPEQSKTVKKRKSNKNRVTSATTNPSSPSVEDRQAGREFINEPNPATSSKHQERNGEGGLKGSDEDEEYKKEGEDEGEEERKRRGLKGHKDKLKRQPKQTSGTPIVSRHHAKEHKKPKKKKVNQSHHERHLAKSKPRRIPRLTLTLMTSAKPSKHLSPITALAHKISDNPMIEPEQTVFSVPSLAGKLLSPTRPAPHTPHTASSQGKRQNTHPKKAEKKLKDTAKPTRLFKARGPEKGVMTQEVLKAADFVLPPISSPSSTSLCSKTLSLASHAQLTNKSASSSSVSLPGLQKHGD